MADPVRIALVQKLLATGSVTSLLGAANNVFHRVAPRNAIPPYVVLHRQAETDRWAFGEIAIEHDVWTIKAICRGSSSGPADDIAAAIKAALNDAALAINGYGLLNLRSESKIDYGEIDAEERYSHVGHIFRVDLDPA